MQQCRHLHHVQAKKRPILEEAMTAAAFLSNNAHEGLLRRFRHATLSWLQQIIKTEKNLQCGFSSSYISLSWLNGKGLFKVEGPVVRAPSAWNHVAAIFDRRCHLLGRTWKRVSLSSPYQLVKTNHQYGLFWQKATAHSTQGLENKGLCSIQGSNHIRLFFS